MDFYRILVLADEVGWGVRDFPNVRRWVSDIKTNPRLKNGINNEDDLKTMIKVFKKTGVWGLKYPLAKI